MSTLLKRLRRLYFQIISSISFYPMLIAIGFVIVAWLMLTLDFSQTGADIKIQLSWVRLKDASTARTLLSTIAASVLSLTVFSFSLVMIILNQAASQISNRTLDSMISNRFQQVVLGFYIGTIVYSLILLSTIRSSDAGIQIPALSIYLLMILTVVDIFLFIYFLHFATQTVKYGTIIKRIHDQTKTNLCKQPGEKNSELLISKSHGRPTILNANESGYFQGFDKEGLLKWTVNKDCIIRFLYPPGTYHLKDCPFLEVYNYTPAKDEKVQLFSFVDFYHDQMPNHHYYFGFLHLTEIAIKALSPGLNDPSTAVLSLDALRDIFSIKMKTEPGIHLKDKSGDIRIIRKEWTFGELFNKCIDPIWYYGKDDQFIREAMTETIKQLSYLDEKKEYSQLFGKMNRQLSSFKK